MQRIRSFARKTRGKRSLAGMLLGLWVFVVLLAAVPALHHVFHSDADSPTHKCVVEQLGSGIHLPIPDAIIARTSDVVSSVPADLVIAPTLDVALALSRGPPCAMVHTVVAG